MSVQTSTPNGIGLVKLMGRHAGWIAMHSSLAARDVDLCLIPEVDFYLKGKGSIMEHIINRLRTNKHCTIVIAEGAGQKFVSAVNKDTQDCSGNVLRDASGNKVCQ
jgi:6-phosphofructokinase 1